MSLLALRLGGRALQTLSDLVQVIAVADLVLADFKQGLLGFLTSKIGPFALAHRAQNCLIESCAYIFWLRSSVNL